MRKEGFRGTLEVWVVLTHTGKSMLQSLYSVSGQYMVLRGVLAPCLQNMQCKGDTQLGHKRRGSIRLVLSCLAGCWRSAVDFADVCVTIKLAPSVFLAT